MGNTGFVSSMGNTGESDKENLHKDAQKVHAKKVSAFRKLMSSTESEENISIRDPQGSDPMKGLDRVDERLSEDEARKIVSNDRSEEVDRVEDRPTKFQDSQNKIRGSPDENDDHISSSSKSQSDALEKIVEKTEIVKRSSTEEVEGELEPAGKKRRISERLKTRDRARLVKRFQRLTRRELEEMIVIKIEEQMRSRSEMEKLREKVDSYDETILKWRERAETLEKKVDNLRTMVREYRDEKKVEVEGLALVSTQTRLPRLPGPRFCSLPFPVQASVKMRPPKPTLTIKRDPIRTNHLILSWNLNHNPSVHASISAYQLYSYQENMAGPNTHLWRMIGEIKAMPLPIACTLQFSRLVERIGVTVTPFVLQGLQVPLCSESCRLLEPSWDVLRASEHLVR